jgi:hypothetical protein
LIIVQPISVDVAKLVPDLFEMEATGEQHGLAAEQALGDILRITERHDSAEIFDVRSGVGRGPLVSMRAIGSNKQDVLRLSIVLAVA